jgi:hypothetical protein
MMKCENASRLKERHTNVDFIYFKLLTAVPLFTVLVGFWRTSPFMMLPYLLWIGIHMTLVYRLLCTHCPHYGSHKGKTQCHYLSAIPAFFKARPVPQSFWEKAGVMILLLISILFPVNWLLESWELLTIYLLSVAALLVTMMRYECTRCVHLDCPHNTVSEEDASAFKKQKALYQLTE